MSSSLQSVAVKTTDDGKILLLDSNARSTCMAIEEFSALVKANWGSQLYVFERASEEFLLWSKLCSPDHFKFLWEIFNNNYASDIYTLDGLIRLARTDALPAARELDDILGDYGFKKTDDGVLPLWNVLVVAQRMRAEAIDIMEKHCRVREHTMIVDAVTRFGPLTESIQIKAQIAVKLMEERGICVDLHHAASLRERLTKEMDSAIEELLAMEEYADMFFMDVDEGGNMVVLRDGRFPRINAKRVVDLLLFMRKEIYNKTGRRTRLPKSDTGGLSVAVRHWEGAADHPFLNAYIKLGQRMRLLKYLEGLSCPVVHPEYVFATRTGRTSTANPNFQGCPSAGGMRECFVPRPGHVFLVVDYNYIELCTLAAVCEARYGNSVMADAIRKGIDPHAFTAAMFDRMPMDEFMLLKDSADPDERAHFRAQRQRAKAINFGIPGGQGARSLREYARGSFGVNLSVKEARVLKTKFMKEVYPEIGMYLYENSMALLAANLHSDMDTCWAKLKNMPLNEVSHVSVNIRDLRMIIRGKPYRQDGGPFSQMYLDCVWNALREINNNADLEELLADKPRARLEDPAAESAPEKITRDPKKLVFLDDGEENDDLQEDAESSDDGFTNMPVGEQEIGDADAEEVEKNVVEDEEEEEDGDDGDDDDDNDDDNDNDDDDDDDDDDDGDDDDNSSGVSAQSPGPPLHSMGSNAIFRRLFEMDVATLTGRIRGRVHFTQSRNTPFSGLAADGAKLALWNLAQSGFDLVGFVHDEILVELPEQTGTHPDYSAEARLVERIMIESMAEVCGSVPIACKSYVATRWHKDCDAKWEDGRLVASDL